MKKAFQIVAILLVAISATSRPVSLEQAQKIAEKYFSTVKNITPEQWDEIYLFTPVGSNGFIIISADDCARPVLAYSTTSQFDPLNMPSHVESWIDGYRKEIASLREAGVTPSLKVQSEWLYGAATPLSSSVPALMTTTWDQSPRYNSECPYSSTDKKNAVTGCVATATAQIMKYWNHPIKGHSVHGYKCSGFGYQSVSFDTAYSWSSMPNALSWSSTSDEIHAVAQLMYHVGVAVEMNYGVKESGAHILAYGTMELPSSERALKEHFRYNPMMKGVWKNQHTDTEWDSLLRNEIGHGRPVLYSGRDNEGGHAFVIDGYNTEGKFHVNWGWGGWYDGYYTIDSLSPGGGGTGGNATYTFNIENSALIQIFPSYGDDTVAVFTVASDDTTMGIIAGNGTYDAYHDTATVIAIPHEGYRFNGWASGLATNPYRFVPNGDFTDTAYFVPLNPDSLAYCDKRYWSGWKDDNSNITEWGIRIPASQRNPQRSLASVQLYAPCEGYYRMTIYYGDSIDATTQVYQQQVDMTESIGWTTIELPEPIALVGNSPLWITFRFSSSGSYPAAMSFYTGIEDGSWYRLSGEWVRMSDHGIYTTWMIQANFIPRNFIVNLQADGFVGQDNVTGGGEYAEGESCTLASTYAGALPFCYWDFGHGVTIDKDPYTFTVTQDTSIMAVGTCIGIDDVDGEQLAVFVQGLTISLQGAEKCSASLYNLDGRLLGTGRRFTVPCTGIYLLRTTNGSTFKVTVFK